MSDKPLSQQLGELTGEMRGLREVIHTRMDATDKDVAKFARIVSDHSGEVRSFAQNLRLLEEKHERSEKDTVEYRKELNGNLAAHVTQVEQYKDAVVEKFAELDGALRDQDTKATRIEAKATGTEKEVKQLKVLAKWSLAASAASAMFAAKGIDEGVLEAVGQIAAMLGKLFNVLA